MRRRHWGRAPKVKPVKEPRPKVGDLRGMYRKLISADLHQRVNTLSMALQWYDEAKKYVQNKQNNALTIEQSKDLDVATKCRLKAASTHSIDEKENALRMAIRRFERIVKAELTPPPIEDTYALWESKKPRLETRMERLQLRYDRLIKMLTESLKPVNAQGEAVKVKVADVRTGESYQLDPTMSEITLSRKNAHRLYRKWRREGVYFAVLEMLEPLSRLAVMEEQKDGYGNPTGQWMLAKGRQTPVILQMLQNFGAWARQETSPKRLVRIPVPVLAGQVTTAPKRTGSNLKRGPKVAGAFVENTGIAQLFQTLQAGGKHSKNELFKLHQNNLKGRLKRIDFIGRENGQWTVQEQGDLVWMEPVQKAVVV